MSAEPTPTPKPDPGAVRAVLWPKGLGITNRDSEPEECSCCPSCDCSCCSCFSCGNVDMWWVDADFNSSSKVKTEVSVLKHTCCSMMSFGLCTNFSMEANLQGEKATFEGHSTPCDCAPGIDIYDGHGSDKRYVGKTEMACTFCQFCGQCCCEKEMAAGYVGTTKKFTRTENCCCPSVRQWDMPATSKCCCCFFGQTSTNINGEGNTADARLATRQATGSCASCFGEFLGIEGKHFTKGNYTRDEQLVLAGLILTKWWRSERERRSGDEADEKK